MLVRDGVGIGVSLFVSFGVFFVSVYVGAGLPPTHTL